MTVARKGENASDKVGDIFIRISQWQAILCISGAICAEWYDGKMGRWEEGKSWRDGLKKWVEEVGWRGWKQNVFAVKSKSPHEIKRFCNRFELFTPTSVRCLEDGQTVCDCFSFSTCGKMKNRALFVPGLWVYHQHLCRHTSLLSPLPHTTLTPFHHSSPSSPL